MIFPLGKWHDHLHDVAGSVGDPQRGSVGHDLLDVALKEVDFRQQSPDLKAQFGVNKWRLNHDWTIRNGPWMGLHRILMEEIIGIHGMLWHGIIIKVLLGWKRSPCPLSTLSTWHLPVDLPGVDKSSLQIGCYRMVGSSRWALTGMVKDLKIIKGEMYSEAICDFVHFRQNKRLQTPKRCRTMLPRFRVDFTSSHFQVSRCSIFCG